MYLCVCDTRVYGFVGNGSTVHNPRKEQDILILLVIDNMFHEQDNEEPVSDADEEEYESD